MASVVPFLVGQFEITSHHSLVCMAPATASAVNLAGQVASKGNFVFLAFEMSFVITNFISGYEQSLSPPHWGAQLQVKLLFYPRRCSKTTSLLRSRSPPWTASLQCYVFRFENGAHSGDRPDV